MFGRRILLSFPSLLALVGLADAGTCYNCASQILLAEWPATSYPVQPNATTFFYGDACFSAPDSTSSQRDCSSNCVEALYVVNGAYAILRGCLADFLGEYFNQGEIVSETCSYGQSDTPVTIVITSTVKNGGGSSGTTQELKTFPKPYVGAKFCNPTDDPCNIKISDKNLKTLVVNDNKNNNGWADMCTAPSGTPLIGNPSPVTCVQCAEYDGVTQKCGMDATLNKDKCTGNYCVKVEGKINGNSIKMRGCAPFNPLASDGCVQIKTTQLISFLGTKAIPQ
ncbi:Protein Y17G7B.23 a, partial [Aphelenchoides avenae]